MKVTLLGTGTPTSQNRFQSGVLIEIGESKLLFDAGRGTVHQLYQANINVGQVNPVFITHHHFDHINDLFDVIISSALAGRIEPLAIYGPAGTQRIVLALLEQVYAQDIRFRIEEDKAIRRSGGDWDEHPEAIANVTVQDIEPGLVVKTDSWQLFADDVLHGRFPSAPDFEWRCLGYRIEANGKAVVISGDTVYCDGLLRLAQNADLLIQCCHLPKSNVTDVAMAYLTDSILPSSGQVGRIAADAGVKRMVITHLSPRITAANSSEVVADIREDYDGDLLVGYDLMELQV